MTVNNKMPVVTGQFQDQTLTNMNLETHDKYTIVFDKTCTQMLDVNGQEQSCGNAPTLVQGDLDVTKLTGVGSNFYGKASAGFVSDGRLVYGSFATKFANGTMSSGFNSFMFTVNNITDDAWNYNMPVGSGSLSLSMNSTFISQTQENGSGGFVLESGPVLDQSFAGGSAASTSTFYAGGGDYSTLFDDSASTTITLTPAGDGAYKLISMGFGQVTEDSTTKEPTSAYFQPLGYPGQRQDAVIATNFVGLGLPNYLWYQLTNLLYKVDESFNTDLTCDFSDGGMCKLANPCSSYTNLWNNGWAFNIMFQGATDYINFPLGALAEEDTTNSQCNIYIQILNDNHHAQSSQVVFGSMFLQMFKNYVSYDLASFTTTYKLQKSASCTLNNAYVGSASVSTAETPFTALYGAEEQIYINTDLYHYKTTIGAQLGFQGNVQFQVSLLGEYIQTFQWDCLHKGGGTRFTSCEDEPILAENYFNQTVYQTSFTPSYTPSIYGGYNTSGYTYNVGVCVQTAGTKYFCTTSAAKVYSADSVYNDNWNYASTAASGTFGLGASTAIWEIVGSPATKLFDVYMANFNAWTWADSTWTATTTQSFINLSKFSSDYAQSDPSTSFSPYQGGSYLFYMEEFGFGKTDTTQNTEYYESILNYNVNHDYGIQANTSSLALNFRGLGLPHEPFNHFSNLLSVVTKGESTCLSRKSGYCALSNPCDHYANTGLWDYDFKVKFRT